MAIIPRYKLKGLRIKAYDAGSSTPTEIADPITSEYDDTNKVFGKLGDVFSISAQGYADYINGAKIEECQAKRFDGASRVCIYPTTEDSHPEQILALLGFNSERRPYTWPGYYPNADAVSIFASGNIHYAMALSDGRIYFTLVYDKETTNAYVYWACDKTFANTVCEHYPSSCDWIYNQHPWFDESWIMSYVEAVEIIEETQKHEIDVTSMFLGWLAGKRIAAMRNKKTTADSYLYNGVQLPPPPAYNKDTYSVAMVSRGKVFGSYLSDFYVAKSIAYRNSDEGIRQVGLEDCMYCYAADGASAWSELKEAPVNPYWIADVGHESLLWTNTDILNADGTVSLTASDPVPVYD